MNQTPTKPAQETPEQKKTRLETWLDRNFDKIEQGKAEGADTKQAEKQWHGVLKQYEALCDQIRQA